MLKLIKILFVGATVNLWCSGANAEAQLEGTYKRKGHENLCQFTCDGSGYDDVNLFRICDAPGN